MHRIDTPTAQKDKFGAGKNGFTRGNPQTGTPATDLDDDYFDMLQEELAGVVEATGVNLEKSKHNQLLTALKALLLSRAHPFADIKADGAAAIAEALSNLGLSLQTSVTDNVQGRVLVAGKSFGLGFGNSVNQRPNPNTFPPAGFYTSPADDVGLSQLPGGYVGLISLLGATAWRSEIAMEKTGRMFIRGADGENVPGKNWYECYTEKNKPTAADTGALPVDGNAASATKLKTARTINGVPFDGSSNITISTTTGVMATSGRWLDNSTGLLIQWGTQRDVGSSPVQFNYGLAFSAIYGGVATIKSNSSVEGNNSAYFFTPDLTTGVVVNDAVTTTRLCDIFWIAIGKV